MKNVPNSLQILIKWGEFIEKFFLIVESCEF